MISRVYQCHIEFHTELWHEPDCSNTSIHIEIGLCQGYCFSQDYLVYDWHSESKLYRHRHNITCCSPTITITREIKVSCNDRQQHIIKYPFVIRCQCKPCKDYCIG